MDLPQTSPYVLEIDRDGLEKYGTKAVGAKKINVESIREPRRGTVGFFSESEEMTWRFNNRKNPFPFRDTMLRLIHSVNLEYKVLVNEKERLIA